jgi:hypothetical protein
MPNATVCMAIRNDRSASGSQNLRVKQMPDTKLRVVAKSKHNQDCVDHDAVSAPKGPAIWYAYSLNISTSISVLTNISEFAPSCMMIGAVCTSSSYPTHEF